FTVALLRWVAVGAGGRRQRRLVGVSGASMSISRAGRSRLGGLRHDTRWQRAALQIVELVVIGIGDRRPIALRREGRLGGRIRVRRRVVLRQSLASRRSEADQ